LLVEVNEQHVQDLMELIVEWLKILDYVQLLSIQWMLKIVVVEVVYLYNHVRVNLQGKSMDQ
jgi:hypothetical protein